MPDTDPKAVVDTHRRTKAVEAESSATFAEIDADAARRLRELVPDLLAMAAGQIEAAEAKATAERARADQLRAHAAMSAGDFPSLVAEAEARLAANRQQQYQFEEQVEFPDLYTTPEMAGGPDPLVTFRWNAANARANADALEAWLAKARPAKRGRRPTQDA